MIGIFVSGGVSGGHLNPGIKIPKSKLSRQSATFFYVLAVTLSMAVLKKCSWVSLPVYWIAQYLGAFIGAAVLYGIYYDGISSVGFDDYTKGIFASYPNGVYNPSNITLAFDQVLIFMINSL